MGSPTTKLSVETSKTELFSKLKLRNTRPLLHSSIILCGRRIFRPKLSSGQAMQWGIVIQDSGRMQSVEEWDEEAKDRTNVFAAGYDQKQGRGKHGCSVF